MDGFERWRPHRHSRSFNFANLSADGISAVEVYKTGRADMTTGGIGATINIKTVRPFDISGTVVNAHGQGVHRHQCRGRR